MGTWRAIFCGSEHCEDEADCVFNPPATEDEIAAFESNIGAPLPADVREMLLEFNGIDKPEFGTLTPFMLGINQMKLPEFYTDWDVPTDKLIDWSKNIVYVRQLNSFTYLWGVVVKPFANFKPGDIVELDHDDIDDDADPSDLFQSRLNCLEDVIRD